MKNTFLLLIVLIFCSCGKQEKAPLSTRDDAHPKKQRICLNMIVKNESAVIRRCLDSVKPYIDYWVIVDTGSKDETPKIIKQHLKDIPGELHHRPWRNFGENRTEALALAQDKGDYILFMDADDWLETPPDYKFPALTHDLYQMWRGNEHFTYIKPQLAKSDLAWKWNDVTHEYLDCGHPYTSATLEKIRYISGDDGASRANAKKKFTKNVKLLKAALKKDPHNSRYVFYIAESYFDGGSKGQALEWYQKRIGMGGWSEEVFWSKFRSAYIMHELGMDWNIVSAAYIQAHLNRPHRPEPIYYLASGYNERKQYEQAYQILKMQLAAPQPVNKDWLFNHDWMRESGLIFQLSIASFYVGHYQESLDYCDAVLKKKNVPDFIRQLTLVNREFPVAKLTAEAPKKQNKKSRR